VNDFPFHKSLVHFIARVAWIAALIAMVAPPALAQQTRAEEIAQRQAEKSQRLTPNTPTGMERALNWFEAHFTDPNTVYMTFGGVYPGSGFAPGVAVRAAFGQARVNIGGAYSIRASKLAHASLSFPELAANKLELETRVRWMDAPQVPFYGIGSETIRDTRVNYNLRALDVAAGGAFKPTRWYRIGAEVASRRLETREGAGTRPSIETRYSGLSAPGLFTETRYTQTTAFTAIDWRESAGYSRTGGLYSIALNDFRHQHDAFSFRRLDINLSQLIPVLKEQWVFGVRGLMQTTTAEDGQRIPFYLLPSLGGADRLRGYPDFRFQDKHLLLVGAEYRWIPSRIIDMALFVDAGKVAPERRDLDFNGLKTTYGIGVRFHGPTFTPLRIDVARGDEGIRAHITGGVTF
jgi:hypothetical protein